MKSDENQVRYTIPGFFPQGGQGAPPEAVCPLQTLLPPEIWSENNSIAKEICITIDFAPPEKIPGRKPDSKAEHAKFYKSNFCDFGVVNFRNLH